VANTLKLLRNGAVGFIDWLDGGLAPDVESGYQRLTTLPVASSTQKCIGFSVFNIGENVTDHALLDGI
jgi:hypothetical protein